MSPSPRVATWSEMEDLLGDIDLMTEIEAGFVAYSNGDAVIPPVGELRLDAGDVHIKYGYLRGGDCYVVKIASGFHGNADLGLSTSGGMMLLFRQSTGEPLAVLLDEGRLTDIRTAVAGAIAAKYMAPERAECVGIVGTGIQARLQLEYLRRTLAGGVPHAVVWGRSPGKLASFGEAVAGGPGELETTTDMSVLTEQCRLIVTTTPAVEPLIAADLVRPGTHITAVGSDTADKQELEVEILRRADVVVADSIPQCRERGEISHGLRQGALSESDLVELGAVIAGSARGRRDDEQITVADLTGVAVQDLQIARAVLEGLTAAG